MKWNHYKRGIRLLLAVTLGTLGASRVWADDATANNQSKWPKEIQEALAFENQASWQGGKIVDAPIKQGQAALRWANHLKRPSIKCLKAPKDLSACNTMSFWLYSEHADSTTFIILFESRYDKNVFSYYSKKITVNWTGWKQCVLPFTSFAENRAPAGWNKIDNIVFTAKGWNQHPTDEPVWILDDLQFTFKKSTSHHTNTSQKLYAKQPAAKDFLTYLQPNHPRLIVTDDDLPRIRKLLDRTKQGRKWFTNLTREAQRMFNMPVSQRVLADGRRLLSISRQVCDRMYTWGLLYRLRGDQKWLDRAWLELESVLKFKDWNPSHFLDTAEMMHAVAIGYDWFYQGLDEQQRQTIQNGLWKLGLRPAYQTYTGPKHTGIKGWPWMTNNWSFVCNGGVSLAAMAMLDKMPKECSKILHQSYGYIQRPLSHFEPDGAWWEGIAYWGYAMQYLATYLRSMETAFGTDFGFLNALRNTGFEKTGDWPIYLTSPLGNFFNFADSGSGNRHFDHWALFFLASHFQNPLYQQFQEQNALGSIYDIVYDRPMKNSVPSSPATLDKYFRRMEVATFRSAWNDDNALFAGIKCGRNGIAHAHQDLGIFIFYALGEKWFIDLGTEKQTYQTHQHHQPRQNFYRIREEGHNTLVFDPQKGYSQGKQALSQIVAFESSPQQVFAIADLTQAYQPYATSVKRGYMMFDHRRRFLIQDEITTNSEHDLWWFAHADTGTQITINESGKQALLKRRGKNCYVSLLSPADAQFTIMDAKPLPTSPDPKIQTQNQSIRKLAINIKVAGTQRIAVMFDPVYSFDPLQKKQLTLKPLADWKNPQHENLDLAWIKLDDVMLPHFDKNIYTYTVRQPMGNTTLPKITAVALASNQHDVKIKMPPAFPGTARIFVIHSKTKTQTTYQLHFVPHGNSTLTYKGQSLCVYASQDDGNGPEKILDKNPSTRWSAFGPEQWVCFAFEKSRKISDLSIAWYMGGKRKTRYDIQISDDAKTWTKLLNTQSSGTSNALEPANLPHPVTTRYLKITCYGNTKNLWNSITEVNIH